MFTDVEVMLMARNRTEQRAIVAHAQGIVDSQAATISALQRQLAAARRDLAAERGRRNLDTLLAVRARKQSH